MNEDSTTNENGSISIDEITSLFEQYFYSKEEQKQINEVRTKELELKQQQEQGVVSNEELILQELVSINRNIDNLQNNTQYQNNQLHLGIVFALGIFILVMFYKYLRNFI